MTVWNGFGFDPLRPSVSVRGYFTLVASNGTRVGLREKGVMVGLVSVK